MLEPTGPLPPEIYWRRRVFAIGILVVVLALVIWLVVAISRGGDTSGETPAAAASSTGTEKPTVTSARSPAPSTAPSKTEAAGSREPSKPSGTAPSGDAPIAEGQCPDQSLAVKVTVEQPTYRVGEQPVFGVVITNISSGACTRDMGSGLQRVAVYSLDGKEQLWASTDCYPDGEPDVRTLDHGEQAAFTVTWSGSTSQPGCEGDRLPVPAGAYHVVAQLGTVRSAPEPFNLA
ncbi:lipase chaperone [Nocardia brevicatena]|uniref:lipase chaperone n=1 Tax=Nocardia brevicatena TaxID=37327 RepID=UPI000592A397|nr:lipase chaperone [Nocardia brevicatena]